MAVNVRGFAGRSRASGTMRFFNGQVGRVWNARNTTQRLNDENPASDVRARQEASTQDSNVSSQHDGT